MKTAEESNAIAESPPKGQDGPDVAEEREPFGEEDHPWRFSSMQPHGRHQRPCGHRGHKGDNPSCCCSKGRMVDVREEAKDMTDAVGSFLNATCSSNVCLKVKPKMSSKGIGRVFGRTFSWRTVRVVPILDDVGF